MHGHGRRGRLALQAAGLLVAVACGVLLVVKAQDGVRSTNALSSRWSVNQAAAQDSYYNCLSDQAEKLVPTGASVALSTESGSAQSSTLFDAIVGWAHIVADTKDATVVLGLVPGKGPGSCAGSVVVATPRAAQ